VTEQATDLRSFLQSLRRHKFLVAAFLLLGCIAGGAYGVQKPPMLTSTALVVLPSTIRSIGTQTVIADSDPVLAGALREIGSAMPLQTLQSRVHVTRLTSSNILSVSAQGTTAKQAEQTANAVANSYIAYVGSASAPTGQVKASVVEPATSATGTALPIHVAVTALLGALAGALLGAGIALAISRRDRRLRDRDDISDAIGVPVLASIQVGHPSDPGGWTRLLESYKPSAVDTLRLRTALDQLGVASGRRQTTGTSVAVLSLSRDRGALAIGPQIAAFAASLGIPTTLVFGPQQDPDTPAILRAACAALQKQSRPLGNLWVTVHDQDNTGVLADVGLTVVVSVVDSQSPNAALTMPTAETVLGVSSGAATVEQLARVAASAFANDRYISGILVADPDPADRTTGRLPQVARSGRRRMPTRAMGRSVETRS
jgi:capsular polysaccharide biosynthesis protein